MPTVEQLKDQYSSQLIQTDGVQAVGVGLNDDGEKVIVVTTYPNKSQSVILPQGLDSSKVVFEESDDIKVELLTEVVEPQLDRKAKHRPVPCGVSTGHPDITAGTVGFNVTDGTQVFTGSNNHVYAAVNKGTAGDPLYQPGPADGGTSADQSATLKGFIKVEDGALVDFAWGSRGASYTNELAGVGYPKGSARRVQVGDVLIKSGRTTGVTEGTVQQVNASVNVNFGDAGTITMEDQIITGDMSDGGDSGSAALFKSDNAPAGVLFAGSSSATVFNQAVNVESETGFTIVTEEGTTVPTANVNLSLQKTSPDTGNVAGQITDADTGAGIDSASVNLQGDGAVGVTTDSNGEFLVNDVTITTWEVTASKEGYNDASTTIVPEDFN